MDSQHILTADLLDLVFDNRNKDYGAYELRRSYHRRIKKALLLTGSLFTVITVSAVFIKTDTRQIAETKFKTVDIIEVQDEVVPPEVIPPKAVEPPPQERTIDYVEYKIVDKDVIDEPAPTKDEVDHAKIADFKQEGLDPTNIASPEVSEGTGKGIIEQKVVKDEIWTGPVEKEASYEGDWLKFLTKNLNAQIPSDNGAPAGKYRVVIQFVVDRDGTISAITPMTNMGYGMEQEAMRVIRKSLKWTPAFQNSDYVKAYRKQPITFEVLD